MTVARRLAANFSTARHGASIAFASDLPPAAGMSSSSALMVMTFLLLGECNRVAEDPAFRANIQSLEELAGYLGTVENGQTFKGLVWRSWRGDIRRQRRSHRHTLCPSRQVGRSSPTARCVSNGRLKRRTTIFRDRCKRRRGREDGRSSRALQSGVALRQCRDRSLAEGNRPMDPHLAAIVRERARCRLAHCAFCWVNASTPTSRNKS